jgi:aryl-alcohol dehydrogenase-like predicted oxidoreductase
MESLILGRSTLTVSRIGLGGLPFGGHYGSIDKEDILRTTRAAVEGGITFFDTSPSYGSGLAERFLGDALGSGRDTVVIATKNGTGLESSFTAWRPSNRHTIARQVEESLKRLRRNRIDLYCVYGPDPRSSLREIMAGLEDLRETGAIRAIGFCTTETEVLREVLQYGRVDAVLAPYNILNRTIETELAPFCRATRISILACEPFCRGLLLGAMHKNSVFDLADLRVEDRRFRGERFRQNIEIVNRLRSLAYQEGLSLMQLALGWVLQNAAVSVAICGAKTYRQIGEAIAAADVQLTPEQINAIDQIVGNDVLQHAESSE